MTYQSRFEVTHKGRKVDARGYIVDEAYINRFFDLQSPGRMLYSLRCAGFDPVTKTDFRYCDLGCGYGLTVLMLARCHPDAHFVGIDINPDHIAWAQEIAAQHGIDNVEFICQDFGDTRAGAPFDFIAAHGIYTWVAPEIQDSMLGFVQDNLAEDGLFYMSYNAYPGWGSKESLWHVVNRFASGMEGSSTERTRQAMGFLQFLSGQDTPYWEENPAVKAQFDYLTSEDLRYVAHEYCNQNFRPVYASQAFDQAKGYGLEFVAQAETVYSLPHQNEYPFLNGMLGALGCPEDREIWISLLRNDEFRSDVYAAGMLATAPVEQSALWNMHLTLMCPVEDVPGEITCGTAELMRDDPLVAILLEEAQTSALSLKEISALSGLALTSPAQVLEVAQLLDLSGLVRFVDGAALCESLDADAQWLIADDLTASLLTDALRTGNLSYVPAPAFGTAIHIEPLLAYAVLALCQPNPASALHNHLAEDAPNLLSYPVDEAWCARFLAETKSRWAAVFGKGGTFCS